MMTRRPRSRALLSPGDTVGVVATGFAVRRPQLDAGLRRLRRMGYRVRTGEHVGDRDGYLAGSDDDRLHDLRTLLADPDVRAIWFVRGGYGTARLLDRVPWRLATEKVLVGYSDLTALFCPVVRRGGGPCLYGPVVAELADSAAYHRASLQSLLAGRPVTMPFAKRQVLVPGRARGRLIGGNLRVLAHLWGTRFAPDLRGSVLLLEEVGEETYRVDSLLTQLRLSGAFRHVSAVLLGRFSVPRRRRFPPDRPFDRLIHETFAGLGVPVVEDLPIGHAPAKWTVPLGGTAVVSTADGRVRFEP